MGANAKSFLWCIVWPGLWTLAAPALRAEEKTAPPASIPAAAQPLPSGNSLGDSVNAFIDNVLAAGNRLLELPLVVSLPLLAVAACAIAFMIGRLFRRRLPVAPIVFSALVIGGLLGAALITDRKISRLQSQFNELRTRTATLAVAASTLTVSQAVPSSNLIDPVQVRKDLVPTFGDVSLRPVSYDDAGETVQVQMQNPLAQAYLAVIDLRHPGLEIKLGADLSYKTLTTTFARENDCILAINGEAGNSPGPGSGLGPWRGLLMRQGQTLLQEDPKIPRPFLSFDRQNHALFRAQSAADRAAPSAAYNILWGRLDAIIAGQVQTADENLRQPRTGMGINPDGSRLYLLVVDGRQPGYSMGFTRAQVGYFLKAFGASDGMLCDEGGSSCIYLKQYGGIANIPSDNQGQERATYTHFGIALRKAP